MIAKQPGTYILLIELGEAQTIVVGGRGPVAFPAGLFAYVGSAHGPGGLAARLRRHARQDKRLHWHVDYLLTAARLNGALYRATPDRLECTWAAAVTQQAQTAIAGFGASDCRCDTHLFHIGAAVRQDAFVAWAARSLAASYSTNL